MENDFFMPYVDINDGVARLMNNKKLYAKLLVKYKNDTEIDSIIGSITAGDLENARIQVHTLKGLSANLSLKSVNEASLNLENEIKNGGNIDAALDTLKAAFEKTDAVLGDVISFLEQ